jgi:hypothetical protein
MSEDHSCSSAICRRKRSSYNIHVKLDLGKRAVDIANAIQSPEMMIHTGLKSAQEIETKAVNVLNYLKVKITR